MKKALLVIGFCLACLLLISCDSREVLHHEPDYKNGYKDNHGHSDHDSEDCTIAWEVLSEFKGIKSEYYTPEFGNLGINIKFFCTDWFVCPDERNDGAYFVNYNKDDYIYHYKDGKATLLVEMKARNLMLYGNELYFLSENVNHSNVYIKPHSIYKYNLDTKETSLVLETNAIWLLVSSDGIYYVTAEEKVLSKTDYSYILTGYCYKDNHSQKLNFTTFIPYKEYILTTSDEGIALRNTFTNDITQLIDQEHEIGCKATIYEDILYFIVHDKLYALNLNNGEKHIYDIGGFEGDELYKKYVKHMDIYDYIIIGDDIILSTNSPHVFRINTQRKGLEYFFMTDSVSVRDLFTDGKLLYATLYMIKDGEWIEWLGEVIPGQDSIEVKELLE